MAIKSLILLPVLVYINIYAYSQPDTISLNRQKSIEYNINNISYYRIISKQDNDIFLVKDFYPNWVLEMEGTYKTPFSFDLRDASSCVYRHGKFTYYFPNGDKESEGEYVNGTAEGEWKQYFSKDGKTVKQPRSQNYTEGKAVAEESYTIGKAEKEHSQMAFTYVEAMPEAPYNVSEFLSKNLTYPRNLAEKGISGRIYVKFIIDKDGTITNISSISPKENIELQKIAILAVSELPPWKPGRQDGEAVRTFYTLPINFNPK